MQKEKKITSSVTRTVGGAEATAEAGSPRKQSRKGENNWICEMLGGLENDSGLWEDNWGRLRTCRYIIANSVLIPKLRKAGT